MINGRRVGPPLGIRSIAAAADGAVLLASVHVGGIRRSTDGGATWQPTINVDSDVQEVRAHPNRPGLVMAASAIGLCTSRDGGMTWDVEGEGMHASYCSAVAFLGDDVLVCAAVDHFASQAAIYRRRIDGHDSLVAVGGGLPARIHGIADTGCRGCRALPGRGPVWMEGCGRSRRGSLWAGGLAWRRRHLRPRRHAGVLHRLLIHGVLLRGQPQAGLHDGAPPGVRPVLWCRR